jgi:hypothetical protein
MHSLDPELRALAVEGALDAPAAARAIALESRRVFSLHGELRLAAYAGVVAITGGVGLFVKRNFERIGPLAVLGALVLAAFAAYAWAARARLATSSATRSTPTGAAADGGAPASNAGAQPARLAPVAEYTLLLGALLASAALAFAETQFRLLGPLWSWHLLILAALHAVTAYAFRSSVVLAASLAALVGWFGVGLPFDAAAHAVFGSPRSGFDFATRALACAALVAAWRVADRRARPDDAFTSTFDHALANLAMAAGVAFCVDGAWAFVGLPLVAACAWLAIRHGLRTGREAFVVYGVVYPVIALFVAVLPHVPDVVTGFWFVLIVLGVGATALTTLYRQAKEVRP